MFNTIIETSFFTLHTYGLMIAIGFVLGVWLMSKEAIKLNIDPKLIYEMSFPILLWSMLGARILYIITNLSDYINRMKAGDYFAMLKIWEGGLVFYGGFIASVISGFYYVRKNKLNVYKLMDIITVIIPVSHALGRIGCFSAGCCYGHKTNFFLGVAFPKNSIPYMDQLNEKVIDYSSTSSLHIHPTQLYEVIGLTVIFMILWIYRSKKRFHGEIFLMYIILYGVERSIVEIFRGDGIRKHLFIFTNQSITSFLGLPDNSPILLSTSQFIAILVIIAAFIFRTWRIKVINNLN